MSDYQEDCLRHIAVIGSIFFLVYATLQLGVLSSCKSYFLSRLGKRDALLEGEHGVQPTAMSTESYLRVVELEQRWFFGLLVAIYVNAVSVAQFKQERY